MVDAATVCAQFGMELIEAVEQRRGSVLLKARRGGELVAVKGYDLTETDTYDRKELLRSEAAVLRRVNPCLGQRLYLDYVSDPTLGDWLVTRWIDGVTASVYARELSGDRIGQLTGLFRAIAEALNQIHEAGFLHGDVQPAHVIIPSGALAPVLIDWGLGRRIGTSAPYAGGFVHFAAPEIAAGMLKKRSNIDYTLAAEVYSFGALMALCYTGQTAVDYVLSDPFQRKLERVARGDLRPFGKPSTEQERKLVSVIRQCLAFRSEDRPASLREVAAALTTNH